MLAAFGLDITPTNDRPTGSGGSVQVMEESPGNDGMVRLDSSALAMADIARLTGGGLAISGVVAILRDVARALEYAHARGIVHRDIKPENILLSGSTAVVTDFGIAKALSASRNQVGATLTSVGTSIGTPAYMAPEQIAGDPNLDHRVDLYALGCVAYELLTGRSPFGDRAPQRMLAAHLSETATSVSVLRPDCPPALARLVGQLLEKDPADRPASATEVMRVLDESGTSSSPMNSMQGPGRFWRMLAMWAGATVAVAILAKAAVVGIGLPDWTFPGAVGLMMLGLPPLLITGYVKQVARRAARATPTLTPGGTMMGRAPSGTMATIALRANPHLSWRKTTRAGMITMGGFVLLVVGYMVTRQLGIGPAASLFASGALAAEDKVLLVEFTAAPEDSALAPIVVEAVRAAMSQSTAVQVLAQSDVVNALQQMERPKESRITGEIAREVAARTGARAILGGRLARIGGGYAVSVELTSADQGVTLASYQGTAAGAQDLLPVVDELTKKLRGKLGESLKRVQQAVPLQQATTASLEALKRFTEATRANDIDQDYDRAVRAAREAVALDSTFALAWRKLSVALFNARGPLLAQDSAIEQAARYADKLPPREKYLVLGQFYDRHGTLADRGKALATYQSAYAIDSTDRVVANQLTLLFAFRGQSDSALRYSRRQYQIEPIPTNRIKLAQTLIGAGRPDESAALLDSIRVADPAAMAASVQWHNTHAMVALQRGERDTALADLQVGRNSSSVPMQLNALGSIATIEATAGRLSRAEALYAERGALQASREGQARIDGLIEARGDILFRGKVAAGAARLDAIVAGSQWAAAPAVERPYYQVVFLYARAAAPAKARQVLARWRADLPELTRAPTMKATIASAEGEIALAEGNGAEAVRQFRLAAVEEDGEPTQCMACVDYQLGLAFDRLGQRDSARAAFERYLAFPVVRRGGFDAIALAAVEKRLGELYDAGNNRDKAIQHYEAFVTLWGKADAELQPGVASVRKRLKELQGQEKP